MKKKKKKRNEDIRRKINEEEERRKERVVGILGYTLREEQKTLTGWFHYQKRNKQRKTGFKIESDAR